MEAASVRSAEALFSARWYRVADLRPQLRPQVELRRQEQRGVSWFVLLDETTTDVRRLNRVAYEFVGRLDGTHTVQQVWDSLLAACPEESATQDEIIRLLISMHERGLIEFDLSPDVESMFRVSDNKRRKERLRGLNPLAFRLPLGDPSRWLAPLQPLAPWIFSAGAGALWLVAMVLTGAAAALHWQELVHHGQRLLASPHYLFLTWLLYPCIKLLHETAHALAVRRWGAPVRQVGVSLLLLTPVPYVDASAAEGLRHRHQRALVSAAGIMAELAVAALAMAVWLGVQPGLVRDLALLSMLIGAVSTVLVNGNPLMRFDGYFFFCDLLDLRNLGLRSLDWWRHFFSRRLLGIGGERALQALPGERPWLVAYLPLAALYRITLSLGVGLWVGGHSALLGFVASGLILWSTVLAPLRGTLRMILAAGHRRSAWRAALIAGSVVVALAWLPLPFGTQAQGVVWLPDRAQVRAGTDGVVADFAVADGAHVKSGELIATLRDERLEAAQAALTADAVDLEAAMFTAMSTEPDKVPALREKLAYSRAEAARNQQKLDQLAVRAQADGVLVVPHQADQAGTWRKKGELLGHILTGDPLLVRVALPQEEADLVRGRGATDRVGVRLAEDGYRLRSGTVRRDMDGAVSQLPSEALGERGGGAIPTDPADKDGMATLAPVVLMDVEVAGATAATVDDRIGARAVVRFDHGTLPLGLQALRRLQQLVLQHFNPEG